MNSGLDARFDEKSPSIRRIGPGDRILDYRILEPIGRGGFGDVFRAEHEVLRRVVAIKVPRDADGVPSLRRSARIQASLDDRSVVRAVEASVTHDPPYVVFEHVDGPSLAELVRRAGPLPWPRALPLLRDVARALRHAQERGVVHGDVKPANVLVETTVDGERARLTDFGSVDESHDAKALDQVSSSVALDTAAQTRVAGTLPYLAPEVVRGARPDASADVYAFGVLLFEVLTGRLPEGRELPSDHVPGIPRELDLVFDRCFARHERRAQGFDEVLRALETVGSKDQERPKRARSSSRVRLQARRPSPAHATLFLRVAAVVTLVMLALVATACG